MFVYKCIKMSVKFTKIKVKIVFDVCRLCNCLNIHTIMLKIHIYIHTHAGIDCSRRESELFDTNKSSNAIDKYERPVESM